MSLKPYPEYKDSGVEWLGEVPSGWAVHSIKLAASTYGGAGFPHEYQGREDEEVPFHKVSALTSADPDGVIRAHQDTVSLEVAKHLRAQVFPSGSIVMAKIGAALLLGRIRLVGHPFCIDNNMMAVIPKENTHPRYLYYALQLVEFERIVNPGAVPSLDMTAFRDYSLPFPSFEVQREIADYLDRETAEIDAMAIELDQAMVLIDERFQAEVERCFDSLDAPHMPLRSQIQSMTTGTSVTAAKFAPAAGEPGVLATSAVFGHELDEAAVKSVDPHEYARLTCPLRVNTLLVSRMNTMNLVGKAVTVDRHLPDVYLPDRLWAVEVEVPRYVYWWTRSQSYREQIRGLAVGASDSMKTLSQQAFRGITLPIPPVPQQDAVAAQLDESAELTGALKAELQEAKVVLEERRAALISAAVTGQVDVTSHGVSAAEQLRDELEVHV